MKEATFALGGEVGRRTRAVIENWVLPAPTANPAMLAMFREHDRAPYRDLVPWAGEFAGKYLTHSVELLRLSGDARLRAHLSVFVADLIACQDEDGYLGCWPRRFRLSNRAPNTQGGLTWDTWSHYHAMLGLMSWSDAVGDAAALTAACRIADLMCRTFLGAGAARLVDGGSAEMNHAPAHSLCLLYRRTGTAAYLELAMRIVAEWSATDGAGQHLAGDYLACGLAGTPFHRSPRPRWESLHCVMALAELHRITGDDRHIRAFTSLWWSMLEGDRHNNGGFSSGEMATGNPYDTGAIETCCTIAWMALSVEMLRLTGDPIVADELEMSLLNSGLGLISPSGRWVTYNTPMSGVRLASAHDIVFQARPGSSELNCCSVNGPRALGLLSEWAIMRSRAGIALNFYGVGAMTAALPSGGTLTLRQDTDYPRTGIVDISIGLDIAETFELALRIPAWSRTTSASLNGEPIAEVPRGAYLRISRRWSRGDRIRLEFDLGVRCWQHPESETLLAPLTPWEGEWTLIGPCDHGRRTPSAPRPAPELAKSDDPSAPRARSGGGRLAFAAYFPEAKTHAVAWCVTTVDAHADGLLPYAIESDWWYTCVVNGHEVATGEGLDAARKCPALPLVAGRNVIAFGITGGSGGWHLRLRRGTFIPTLREAASDAHALVSIYRGPILLAYDPRLGGDDTALTDHSPCLASPDLTLVQPGQQPRDEPWLLLTGHDSEGTELRLCDFASAGSTGGQYRSWIPVSFPSKPVAFSRLDPSRTFPAVT